MKDNQGIMGVVTITQRDALTGEILLEYSDRNVVTLSGMEKMIQSFTSSDNFFISGLYLGDDVGSGSKLFPESPSEGITSASQDVLYSVTGNNLEIQYIGQNRFMIDVVLDGQDFMGLFPSEVSIDITSATMRFNDDTAFAYKRFPAITMSRFVNVEIVWEVTFNNA